MLDIIEEDHEEHARQLLEYCTGDSTQMIKLMAQTGADMGSVDDVIRKTTELLTVYRDSPRFILNAGCAIPRTTPKENLVAMIETARGFS